MPLNDHKNSKEEESSLIEKAEEKLYSLTDVPEQKARTKLRPKKFSFEEDWKGNEEALRFEKKEKPSRLSAYAVIFLVSFTFFLVAGGLAGYVFLSKKPAISPDNVSVSVTGSVSIRGGDTVSLQVLIENKNSVALNDTDVLIEFPGGTRSVAQPDKVMDRFYKSMGTIAAGEIRTETIKSVMFGGEEGFKEIAVTVKYQIEGSDARFTKTKTYTVSFTSTALSIKADIVKEVTSGQEITLVADIRSSSPSPIKGGLFSADYPRGFLFKKAVPAPSFGDNAWKLGDMELGDTRHIEITGIMQGADTEEKVFHLSSGVLKNDGSAAYDTVFSSLQQTVVISKPFIGIVLSANGRADENVVFNKTEQKRMSVLWVNNFTDKVIDGQIEVSLKGSAIDRRTIKPADGGYYNSTEDVILWDKRSLGQLGLIPPGGSGATAFSFGFLPFISGNTLAFRNPEVEFGVSVKGKRVSEDNVPEDIKSFVAKKYKISTSVQFAARNVYYAGPFVNSGPLPPEVNKETTYTILWAIKNTVNDVSGAVVKTVLPPYVEWKGKVSPSETDIVYNPMSHEITWTINRIGAGAGYGTEAKEVAFQIGVTPSLSDVKKTPEVISRATLSGKDDFTGAEVGETAPSLSTILSTDPSARAIDAEVAPP